MDIFEQVELNECPICSGVGLLEEENEGELFYVMCMDCGCHTVNVEYRRADDRLSAAQRAAMLWNIGKVISSSPGE